MFNVCIRLAMAIASLFVVAPMIGASLCSHPFSASPAKREVRAVWLATIGGLDWPGRHYARSAASIARQKRGLCAILDSLKASGINTVLLQTRIRGTVIYPSSIEPWDGCMSGHPGVSPGYDPLQFAIDECHSRGMELHAWVVSIPAGKWNGTGCKALRGKHPSMVLKADGEGFLNPANPQTAPYLASICEEIVRGYDVDGIHLDYIRYPETYRLPITKDQARQNITSIVRTIYNKVKQLKPWIKISSSPIGKFGDLPRYTSRGWNAYDKGCQDVRGWLREGLMDQIYPMMYFRGNNFYPFLADWQQHSQGRTVVAGLAAYFLDRRQADWPLSDVSREMEVCRRMGVGTAMFRSRFFTDNTKGVYSFARGYFNTLPALVPAMTWMGTPAPLAPGNLTVSVRQGLPVLQWQPGADCSGANTLWYNVYGSDSYPVDTDNPENIILLKHPATSLTVTAAGPLYYAVTAIDRYGLESRALQMAEPKDKMSLPATPFIVVNDNNLPLPPKGSVLDADYVIIESLTGCAITTVPYRGATANISHLPNGMYRLRSLGRKGRTHRLGIVKVERK